MSAQFETPTSSFEPQEFQHHLPQYYRSILTEFRKMTLSSAIFRLIFFSLFVTEAALTFFSFSAGASRSLLFVFSLGALFLTLFTYFVLHFYFQARKPDELHTLRDRFISSCRQVLPVSQGELHHHLSLAEALCRLAQYLQGLEWDLYNPTKALKPLAPFLRWISARCYTEDVFHLKQLLLEAAIDEQLKQVRLTPTDIEVHVSLANTYVALSLVYKEMSRLPEDFPGGAKYIQMRPALEEKFRHLANLAIEEFKILNHYAPNDPWIHEQLSYGYRNLEMPEDEIKEVEILLKLRPQDKEILFRLGALYFRQGQNARGLQVYEELKRAHYKKGEELIAGYGLHN